MSIITTPSGTPLSAYLPNLFTLEQASANFVKWAFVEVYVDTVLTATLQIPTKSTASPYQFDVDVQAVLQDALAPFATARTGTIGTFNTASIALVDEAHATYRIEATYKEVDPTTGLLQAVGGTDVSADFYAIIATRQRKEAQDFALYIPDSVTPTTQKWLTNAPLVQDICDTENAYLTYIATTAVRRMRLQTFNAAGGLIFEGYVNLIVSTDYEPETIGVGVPSLLAYTWENAAGAPVSAPIFTSVASYKIGLSDTVGPYPDYIQIRTYNIVDCCDTATRLHWVNLLGGGDAYTFKSRQKVADSIQFIQAQKALDTTFNYSDKGAFKLISEGATIYETTSEPLTAEDANWLKELALSVEVYLETADGFLPVLVTVEEVETEKQINGELNLVQIKITFAEANKSIIQHS